MHSIRLNADMFRYLPRLLSLNWPTIRRLEPSELSSGWQSDGDPIPVIHADAKDAERMAIDRRFLRLRYWEGRNVTAYIVLGQTKRGHAVCTKIQAYRATA